MTTTVPNPLVVAPIVPTLLRLSTPNAVAAIAQSLVAIAETACAGLLGTDALAGLALVFPFVMLQQMMSAGAMGGGVSSAIARALGANQLERANALALHAVLIGVAVGALAMLLMLAFGPSLYHALGGRGAPLQHAIDYARMVFLGAVSIWLCNTLASVLRGTGNMRLPSLTLIAAALLQAVLAAVLSLGLGPFPRLGMVGLAAGQVIAFTAAAAIMAAVLLAGRSRLRIEPNKFRLDRGLLRDILAVGAIAVISPVQSVVAVLVLTRLVASYGTAAIAGYGIGTRLEFLLVPIVFAVGVASVPMVGMAIGAGDATRARRVAWSAGALAAAVTGIIGVVVALWPALWANLFTSDPAVLATAGAYLRLAGPAFAFYGLGLALYFATQGSGRILGAVLAQSARLATIVVGAIVIASAGYGHLTVFALVALAMLAYGLASALALHRSRWAPAATVKPATQTV